MRNKTGEPCKYDLSLICRRSRCENFGIVPSCQHLPKKAKMKAESFISKVIADGRVTIPKEMREKKGISEGDFVEVQLLRKITSSTPKVEA